MNLLHPHDHNISDKRGTSKRAPMKSLRPTRSQHHRCGQYVIYFNNSPADILNKSTKPFRHHINKATCPSLAFLTPGSDHHQHFLTSSISIWINYQQHKHYLYSIVIVKIRNLFIFSFSNWIREFIYVYVNIWSTNLRYNIFTYFIKILQTY